MNEKMTGATNAMLRLLIRLYVASVATLPPNIPVMTAAAVAVGANIHINAPSAMIGSKK